MRLQPYFWNISLFFSLSFWRPAMADLDLEDCQKWQQDSLACPTYNCSVPENSTIRFPLTLKNWVYVYWRANSSHDKTEIFSISNGVPVPFNSKFKDSCFFSEGYLKLSHLKEDQQGEYEVKHKEWPIFHFYIFMLPDQQSTRNPAVTAAPVMSPSLLLLCCVLLMVVGRELQ